MSGGASVVDNQRHLVWENANAVHLSQSFARTLGIAEDERAAVDTLLTEMWMKYIDLEKEHTKYSRTLSGDLQADIGKFPEARDRLASEFETKLREIVPASACEHIFVLASAGSQKTPSILGWQEQFYPTRVQIRSNGTGFHWYVRPGKHGITGDGPTLPFELAHYLTLGLHKLDDDKQNVLGPADRSATEGH